MRTLKHINNNLHIYFTKHRTTLILLRFKIQHRLMENLLCPAKSGSVKRHY